MTKFFSKILLDFIYWRIPNFRTTYNFPVGETPTGSGGYRQAPACPVGRSPPACEKLKCT